MSSIASLLKKPPVKSVLLAVIALIIGGLCSALGSWSPKEDTAFLPKVAALAVISLVYIGLLIFYATTEVNERRIRGELEKQNRAFETFISNIIGITTQNIPKINTCIRSIRQEGKIDLNVWNFDQACSHMCRSIYNQIRDLGGSDDFAVAYVRLAEENGSENEVYMNGYANQTMNAPSIFNKRRPIPNTSEGNYYHDLELFRRKSSDLDIIVDKETLNTTFTYKNPQARQRNQGKYNQYIAVPVFCHDDKMIGLLEVACLNDARLGITKQEVEEMAKKFLAPYSFIFLLLHKLERALLAVPHK